VVGGAIFGVLFYISYRVLPSKGGAA